MEKYIFEYSLHNNEYEAVTLASNSLYETIGDIVNVFRMCDKSNYIEGTLTNWYGKPVLHIVGDNKEIHIVFAD